MRMTIILLSSLLISLYASASEVDIKKFNNIAIFKKQGVTPLRAFDKGDVYLIQASSGEKLFTFFMTKDMQIIIMGQGLHVSDNQPVKLPLDKEKIKQLHSFNYGSGQETLYLFANPYEEWSKELLPLLPKNKTRYTFKIFLCPLVNKTHHEELAWILNGEGEGGKWERLSMILNGYKPTVQDDAQTVQDIKEIVRYATENDFSGIPSVYDRNLNLFDWTTLKQP